MTRPGFRFEWHFGWAIVAASSLSSLILIGTFHSSYGLFVVPVSQEFGLSRADANTGLVLLSLGNAIISPFIGLLLDRVSVRKVMIVSSVLFGGALALLSQSHSVLLDAAILCTVFAFAVQGAVVFSYPVLIARWFTAHRARAMILGQVGFSLGGVVLPPVIGLMIDSQGWRTALLVTGIAAGVTLLAVALLMRDWPPAALSPDPTDHAAQRSGEKAAKPRPLPILTILRTPQFWTLNLSGGLVIAVGTAMTISLAPMVKDSGLTTLQAATVISVQAATGTISKLLFAAFGDRFERVSLLTILFLAGAVFTGGILLSDSYVTLLLAVAPLGLLSGGTSALLNALVAERFGAASFGTVSGIAQPMQSLATMACVRFAGEVYDRTGGYDMFFIVAVAIQVIAAAMMLSTRFARPIPAAGDGRNESMSERGEPAN